MSHGKKRASGAEDEKSPFADVEITDEQQALLDKLSKTDARVQLGLEKAAQLKLEPVFAKRRAALKSIDKFWPVALRDDSRIGMFTALAKDQQALSYLEDVWIARDPADFRAFTVEFHFKSNPWFKDAVLKKVYKYTTPAGAANETPDEHGVTDSMMDFEWERDVEPQATKIQWSDDAHNLVKLFPRTKEEEETAEVDDSSNIADPGTFFNYFEQLGDPFDFGAIIATDIFPDAIDHFLGRANDGDMEIDSDDEDDDDDDDAEEIDLEKPRPKKQKRA